MTRDGITPAHLNILSAPTPSEEVKQRQGPGGRMLDYIDARFVMDRLDEIGPENWQDQYHDRADGSVRCGIGVLIEGEWVWKWDVGDPSDIESNKGAYSESFKRAGVKWGIARDLYGHTTQAGRVSSSTPAASNPRPVAAPHAPVGGTVPEEPAYLAEVIGHEDRPRTPAQQQAHTDGAFCPDHGMAWVLKPGGVSKTTGKAYDAFYACPSTDRPFCKQKPDQRWLALQEVA